MLRSIKRRLFGRPRIDRWTVSDFIADPPGSQDIEHPLRADQAPGIEFVRSNEAALETEILKALHGCHQIIQIRLCNALTMINPDRSREELLQIFYSGTIERENMAEFLFALSGAINLAGIMNQSEQKRLLSCWSQFIGDKKPHQKNLAMDIVYRMTIPEAAEIARIQLDNYFHGEEAGFYLAKIGDPAGWPIVRKFLDKGLDDQNEYGEMDTLAGLVGLASTTDDATRKEVLKATISALQSELNLYAPSNRRAHKFMQVLSVIQPDGIDELLEQVADSNLDEALRDPARIALSGETLADYLPAHLKGNWL